MPFLESIYEYVCIFFSASNDFTIGAIRRLVKLQRKQNGRYEHQRFYKLFMLNERLKCRISRGRTVTVRTARNRDASVSRISE